ncbi:MAG: DUF2093 domain-containing protein [Pseudomonadota bacterium]
MTTPLGGTPAKLSYLDGDFDVIVPGDFVLCAVTGRRIPLQDLRYWSVSRQEAFADAEYSHEAYAAYLKNGEPF